MNHNEFFKMWFEKLTPEWFDEMKNRPAIGLYQAFMAGYQKGMLDGQEAAEAERLEGEEYAKYMETKE
jgi:hypothetical protein